MFSNWAQEPRDTAGAINNWFGRFWDTFPDLYSTHHGWLYQYGVDGNNLWFYDRASGVYWWTNASSYPWIYHYQKGWLWYYVGGVAPNRWFADQSGNYHKF